MYQFVTARLKKRGNGEVFKTVNISAMTMRDIFNTYSRGYITLTNIVNQTVYLQLVDLKAHEVRMRLDRTFEIWLQGIGSNALPTTTTEPEIEDNIALYSDLVQAGYDIQRVHPTFHPSTVVPESTKTDLLINRPNTDMTVFLNHTIVTVNGLCHITDSFEDKVRVVGGGKSTLIYENNTAGFISFNNIAQLQRIPITEVMLDRPDDDIPYRQTVWIKLGVDLTNKSVLLSLGGYLHINDNAYKIINHVEGIIQINLETVNLVKRIFESKKLIDLDSLDLTESDHYESVLLLPEVNSDEFIVKYLTLSQTFAIVVDAPIVSVETELVEKTNLKGVYTHHTRPNYPLRLQSGLLPEYWAKQEYAVWVLTLKDNIVKNYHFETTRYLEEDVVTDNPVGNDPYRFSIAHLLKIKVQKEA